MMLTTICFIIGAPLTKVCVAVQDGDIYSQVSVDLIKLACVAVQREGKRRPGRETYAFLHDCVHCGSLLQALPSLPLLPLPLLPLPLHRYARYNKVLPLPLILIFARARLLSSKL